MKPDKSLKPVSRIIIRVIICLSFIILGITGFFVLTGMKESPAEVRYEELTSQVFESGRYDCYQPIEQSL